MNLKKAYRVYVTTSLGINPSEKYDNAKIIIELMDLLDIAHASPEKLLDPKNKPVLIRNNFWQVQRTAIRVKLEKEFGKAVVGQGHIKLGDIVDHDGTKSPILKITEQRVITCIGALKIIRKYTHLATNLPGDDDDEFWNDYNSEEAKKSFFDTK